MAAIVPIAGARNIPGRMILGIRISARRVFFLSEYNFL
jgi:hypothetical protein